MKKYFVFMLAEKKFAVEMLSLDEVLLPIDYSVIPEQESYLKGVINLRGEIVTLIDLKLRLGLGETLIVDKKTCYVVFSIDDCKIAVIVDQIEDVVSIDPQKITHVKDLKNSKFVEGVYRLNNDEILLIANEKNLLEIDKIQKLKNIA